MTDRELRTCPVEGITVLLNLSIQSRPLALPRFAPYAPGWRPHDPPAVGVEGRTDISRSPAVSRDGLGAHEAIGGTLAEAMHLARERMTDLRRDVRLRAFGLAGRAWDGQLAGFDLVALPFDIATSTPAAWRDLEIGGARCIAVDTDAVALLAWAPRAPLETWVLPRAGLQTFEGSNPAAVAGLAARTLDRLTRVLPAGTAVDLILVDGAPWRLELRPRLVSGGLFTSATGMPAHGGFPERGAAFLGDFG